MSKGEWVKGCFSHWETPVDLKKKNNTAGVLNTEVEIEFLLHVEE